MRIYVDLDETLIHAKYACSGNAGRRTRIRIKGCDKAGVGKGGSRNDELYYSLLRPKAHELLDRCRTLASVKILTTATRDYALKHNEVFLLGFSPEDIIAREDYLTSATIAYGSTTEPIRYNTDPTAILIDNLPRLATAAMLKQQFLGITPINYIQIREFSGKDPEIFSDEVDRIIQQINESINNIPDYKVPKVTPDKEALNKHQVVIA